MLNLSFWKAWKARLQAAGARFRHALAAHPRRWTWGTLAPLALGVLLLCAPVAFAAVQLNYFTVISFPTSVTLEWSTASEVNVAGFDVQCKLASEPDSAFHEIGYVRAKGGPNVGALYSFNVTGVVPGVSYCFRLKEITTDGSPGEVIDRCGYGPMVTPTPGTGAILIFTPVPVPTDAFGNPILPPTATPAPPAVPTDAFGNPLPPTPFPPPAVPTDAFGNPLPPTPFPPPAVPTDAFGSPLPTPFPPPAVPTDALGNPLPPTPPPAAVPTDAFGSPLITPTLPPAAASQAVPTDAFGNPLVTPIAPASAAPSSNAPPAIATDAFGNPVTPDPLATLAQAGSAAAIATDAFGPLAAEATNVAAAAGAGTNAASDSAASVAVQAATPTPAFLVVTATPTQAPVALAPVLTPLPTTTPALAGLELATALDGGQNLTQNLMIMLLCLTFTGASAIGIVGLITSVMFMRSRSSQREFFERTSIRRRY